MWRHRRLAAALPLLLLIPAAVRQDKEASGDPPGPQIGVSTVILVRHAEKSTGGDPRDPELSEAGVQRAQALARLLGRAGVDRLYASEFKRTQATLAPLAAATGVKVEVLPGAKHKELVALLLASPAGSVSVVAGHSNTIPALVAGLGAEVPRLEATPQGAMLADKDYDRLFVVTLGPVTPGPKRPASLLELAYGD